MRKKLAYITANQITKFIEFTLENTFKGDVDTFIIEVGKVLADLNTFPEDNANQLKFYGRVKDRLDLVVRN